MKIKRVEKTPVTNEELTQYKEKVSKLKGFAFNALDVGMEKRIVTLNFGGDYEELTLVNPIVTEKSEQMVVYFEKDSIKNKTPLMLEIRLGRVRFLTIEYYLKSYPFFEL